MFDTDRSEDVVDGEVLDAGAPACVALVPVAQTVHWARKSTMARPDPTFLTQLIATADEAPQSHGVWRASIEDAQTAYGAHPRERRSVARRTRQVV